MIEAPLPPDEAERIAALRRLQVLDTSRERRYDRLTELASRLLGVPIALISLVDSDRQWFKARSGLDVSQTPRSVPFCAHAILSDDQTVEQYFTTWLGRGPAMFKIRESTHATYADYVGPYIVPPWAASRSPS